MSHVLPNIEKTSPQQHTENTKETIWAWDTTVSAGFGGSPDTRKGRCDWAGGVLGALRPIRGVPGRHMAVSGTSF